MKRRILISVVVSCLTVFFSGCTIKYGTKPTQDIKKYSEETTKSSSEQLSTRSSVETTKSVKTTVAFTSSTDPSETPTDIVTTTAFVITRLQSTQATSTAPISTDIVKTMPIFTTSPTVNIAPITSTIITEPITSPQLTPTTTTFCEDFYENLSTSPQTQTQPIPTVENEFLGFRNLPEYLQEIVDKYEAIYPNMELGVGIYSLDGLSGYQYNADKLFNGACTIKSAYALFVCKQCDINGIDIWSEQLYYTSQYHHGGSGVIQYNGYNVYYTIGELLTYLLGESDNDAMELLLSRFSLNDFYNYNSSINGENDWANWNAGRATIYQRRNEWLAIYNYVNSSSPNSYNLRSFLTNTKYAYLMYNMTYWPTYMHKSGWCYPSYSYPAAADAAIIGDRYLMIVMNQDYVNGCGYTDVISELGNAIDDYDYFYGLF